MFGVKSHLRDALCQHILGAINSRTDHDRLGNQEATYGVQASETASVNAPHLSATDNTTLWVREVRTGSVLGQWAFLASYFASNDFDAFCCDTGVDTFIDPERRPQSFERALAFLPVT